MNTIGIYSTQPFSSVAVYNSKEEISTLPIKYLRTHRIEGIDSILFDSEEQEQTLLIDIAPEDMRKMFQSTFIIIEDDIGHTYFLQRADGEKTWAQFVGITEDYKIIRADLDFLYSSMNLYVNKIPTSSLYNDSNFITKTNTTEYTPTEDYNPSTKKYVDDAIAELKTYIDNAIASAAFVADAAEHEPIA